jgi:hypothetical protein
LKAEEAIFDAVRTEARNDFQRKIASRSTGISKEVRFIRAISSKTGIGHTSWSRMESQPVLSSSIFPSADDHWAAPTMHGESLSTHSDDLI